MNPECSILALIALLETAKVKAQFNKTAAWEDITKILGSYVELRGHSSSDSENIFDVLELALLTEDEPFAETLRQTLIALGDESNATRIMAMIWRERGNGLRKDKRMEEAIPCYRKAIEIYPNFANALNELAISLNDIDQVEEAIDRYREAYRIEPNHIFNLLWLFLNRDRIDEYGEELKVLKSYLNNPAMIYKSGKFFQEIGDHEPATRLFEKLVEAFPEHFSFRLYLSASLLKLERKEEALQNLKVCEKISPNESDNYNLIGSLQKKLGDYQSARDNYRKAIKIDKDNEDFHYNLAYLIFLQYTSSVSGNSDQDLEEAIQAISEAIRLNPDRDSFHSLFGSILLAKFHCKKNDTSLNPRSSLEQSIAVYREALRINSNDYNHHHYLAMALYTEYGVYHTYASKLERLKQASLGQKVVNKALQSDLDGLKESISLLRKAEELVKEQDGDEEAKIKLQANQYESNLLIEEGIDLLEQGKHQKSEEKFKQAILLHPDSELAYMALSASLFKQPSKARLQELVKLLESEKYREVVLENASCLSKIHDKNVIEAKALLLIFESKELQDKGNTSESVLKAKLAIKLYREIGREALAKDLENRLP